MNLQITLILISCLLVIMLGLLIWVIRIALNRKIGVPPQKVITTQKPLNLTKTKYANSTLSKDGMEQYLEQIITAIEIEKIYRQPDLTLKDLARAIDVPKHHVSQIINQQLDSGFIDFINRYRVAEAKVKLQDASLEATSILAIGRQVGFKAKSTFYAAFKKYTQQTPAAFRRGAFKKAYPKDVMN